MPRKPLYYDSENGKKEVLGTSGSFEQVPDAPTSALPTEYPAIYAAMQTSITSDPTTKRDFFVTADETNGGIYTEYSYNGTRAIQTSNLYINVRDFGAVGNGVTDDTTAIQNAINALPTGGELILPAPYSFKVTEINIKGYKQTITGGGKLVGVLRVGFTDAEFDALTWADTHLALKIKDIRFENTSATTTTTKNIIFRNAREIQVQNCQFDKSYKAITFETRQKAVNQHTAKIIVENCTFNEHGYDFYSESATDTTVDGFYEYGDLHVMNNKFLRTSVKCLHLQRQDGLIFTNNTVYFNQSDPAKQEAIFARLLTWANISNNNLFESGLDVIKIQYPQNVVISGNTMAWPGDNANSTTVGSGVVIEGSDSFGGNLHNVVISKNIIDNTVNHGVILRQVSGTGAYPSNVIITSNIFSRIGYQSGSATWNTDYRMVQDDGCLGVVVSNNISTSNKNNPTSANPTGSPYTAFNNNFDGSYVDNRLNYRYVDLIGTATTFNIDAGTDIYIKANQDSATTVTSWTSTYKRNGQKITIVDVQGRTTIEHGTYFQTKSGLPLKMTANKVYRFEMWDFGSGYKLYETSPGAQDANTMRRIFATNVQSSLTGTTTETTLYTGTIPGNSIGANGSFYFYLLSSMTNNANSKTIRIKLNGLVYMQVAATSAASYRAFQWMSNRNSLTSQISGAYNGTSGFGFGGTTSAVVVGSIDTTQPITVTVTAILANSADAVALEQFEVLAVG